MVECNLAKVDVAGSSPVSRSKRHFTKAATAAFFVFALIASGCSVRPAQVVVTVLTEGCPLPLPGVRVRATAPGRADVEQITSADGSVVLALAPGSWLLTAILEGFTPASARVEVVRGADPPVRLLLATASDGAMEIAPHGPCLAPTVD